SSWVSTGRSRKPCVISSVRSMRRNASSLASTVRWASAARAEPRLRVTNSSTKCAWPTYPSWRSSSARNSAPEPAAPAAAVSPAPAPVWGTLAQPGPTLAAATPSAPALSTSRRSMIASPVWWVDGLHQRDEIHRSVELEIEQRADQPEDPVARRRAVEAELLHGLADRGALLVAAVELVDRVADQRRAGEQQVQHLQRVAPIGGWLGGALEVAPRVGVE